jgi:hypothetical protein
MPTKPMSVTRIVLSLIAFSGVLALYMGRTGIVGAETAGDIAANGTNLAFVIGVATWIWREIRPLKATTSTSKDD